MLIISSAFLYSQCICELQTNFFRYDYKYLEDMRSFYKVHTVNKTWQEAKLDLMAKEVYTTVNGDSIKDVYGNWAPGEPNNSNGNEDCLVLNLDGTLNDDQCNKRYPFICKKTLASLKWNTLCNVPDLDYRYDDELGRCYKFHATAQSWTEAALVCDIEQSYLAVLNSDVEAKHLAKITGDSVDTNRVTSNLCNSVALGFSNKDNEGWKTILGTKLIESEYEKWDENQPEEGTEQCGFMSYNGLLKGLSCENKCPFICEHENPLLGSLDERNGS
ncbi:unnamed protein product, partial [Iphiclides podalirius]